MCKEPGTLAGYFYFDHGVQIIKDFHLCGVDNCLTKK